MALKTGIYVFFLENANNQGGQSRAGVVRLDEDGPGGVTYLSAEQLPGLGNGIVACRGTDDDLIVFVADNTQQVWQINFDGQKLTSATPITGVKTGSEMGAINNGAGIHLYYVTNQKGHVITKTNNTWGSPQPLNLKTINNGISAREHDGGPLLCYQTDGNTIMLQTQSGTDYKPPYKGWFTPRFCSYREGLFLVWHSADSSNHCWSSRYLGGKWLDAQDAPNCRVLESPSVCEYGKAIYCFTQGGGNHIYYQLYTDGSWDTGLRVLKGRDDKDLGNIWYSPFALTV